jgi:hypothetical protein
MKLFRIAGLAAYLVALCALSLSPLAIVTEVQAQGCPNGVCPPQ